MNDIAMTVYTTQGVPIAEEGGNVPFDALGIDYEKIDSLGVWLSLRLEKYSDSAFIGMRIDRMLEIGGRENRYVILIKVPKNSLLGGEISLSDILRKLLAKLEEKAGIKYMGDIGVSKWDIIERYMEDLLFVLLTRKERQIEAKIPGLNYFEPSLVEREDVLRLFLMIYGVLPQNAPELFVFSKSGSSWYQGIWLTEHGKDIREWRMEIEEHQKRAERDSERLRRFEGAREYPLGEQKRAKQTNYSRKKKKKKGTPVGAILALFLVGVLIGGGVGFVIVPKFYAPPLAPKGPMIVPVEQSALNATWNNIDSLTALGGNKSVWILYQYLSFIEGSQRAESVNMTMLLELVNEDTRVHQELLKRIEEQENVTKELKSLNLELTKNVSSLNSKLKNISAMNIELNKTVSSLRSNLSTFAENTEYFLKMAGSNVTLTQERLERLKNSPGVEGWNAVMTSYCKLVAANESKTVKEDINHLKNESLAIKMNVTEIAEILRNIKDENLENGTNAFIDLQNDLDEFISKLGNYPAEIDRNVSKVTTCKEAYLLISGWDVRRFNDELTIIINGSEAIGYIDRVIRVENEEDLEKDPFVSALRDYAMREGVTKEKFVEEIRNTLSGVDDPIEKINAFLKFLKRITGGITQ